MLGILMYQLVPKASLDSSLPKSPVRMLWPLLFTTLSLLLLLKSPVSWSRYISEPFQCGLVLMGLSWLLAWWPVKLFVNPVTLFLGTVSYSVYLLHFIGLHLIVWLSRQLVEPVIGHPPSFWLAFPIVTLLSAVIAAAGHRWVEVPGQALGARLFSR